MGVDKEKVVDGITETFLRFITIMTPLNQFLTVLEECGDRLLPLVQQLLLIVFGGDG